MRTMRTKTGPVAYVLLGTLALVLSACGAAKANATPTLGVDAIFTSAAQTFAAQRATELALTPPTDTPAPPTANNMLPTLPALSPFAPLSPAPTFSLGSPTLASGGSACANSTFVSDVTIPDGTKLNPGESFVKTWLLQNNGTCPWTPGYKLVFVDGNDMGGTDALANEQVPVGQQLKISVHMNAPLDVGSYYGRWRMQNEQSQPFGSIVTVVIKVGEPAATNTP